MKIWTVDKTFNMKKEISIAVLIFFLSDGVSDINSSPAQHLPEIQITTSETFKEIDKDLLITLPGTGTKARGKIWIRGKAKPGSFVNIVISSTYYKLGTDQRKRKLFKGEGPINTTLATIKVKTNGQGVWSTNSFNFRNRGWSEEFKIVARSVEGKNATYVIVRDDTKPIIAWD
jgi:hypothetical protein